MYEVRMDRVALFFVPLDPQFVSIMRSVDAQPEKNMEKVTPAFRSVFRFTVHEATVRGRLAQCCVASS